MNLLFFSLSFTMLSTTSLLAQKPKLNVYVWDFRVTNDTLKRYGKDFTNDFETELINYDGYVVLDRRNLNRIMDKNDMENNISNIGKLSKESKQALQVKRADAVFFGELKFDVSGGKYDLSITFESLNGDILKKGSILIDKGEIYHPPTRKEKIKTLFQSLYSKEFIDARKEKYEIIDKKLSIYRARVDEIEYVFEKNIEYLLTKSDPRYSDEVNQKIVAYNEIWNDLNENKGKYLHDFDIYWSKDRLRDLTDIYNEIMNVFHKSYVRKLDQLRTDINDFRTDESLNKKAREEKKKEVIKNTMREVGTMRDAFNNILEPKINAFLSNLTEDISTEK